MIKLPFFAALVGIALAAAIGVATAHSVARDLNIGAQVINNATR